MPNAWANRHDSNGEMTKRLLGRAIAELARRQHGVVARAQLAEIGLGRGAIDQRVARGQLHRIQVGVYAVGHSVLTDEGRWMAAVLAGGLGAVLSHRSAAAHWGIRPSDSRIVEVTSARQRRSRPGLCFYRSYLPLDEVTTHDGIPITTVPRTLFDLAAVVSIHQLRRAVNEAEIRRLWHALSLSHLLERHPRRPGVAAVRTVLATPGTGITRNDFEARFLDLVRGTRLPRPESNVPIEVNGIWIEVDFMWREQRLIVELDGNATHATRSAFESDRARDRALIAAGWRVIRITWRQLCDEPDALARDLRASLTARPVANLRRA
jgi:very-short-patch-repair endonuclease